MNHFFKLDIFTFRHFIVLIFILKISGAEIYAQPYVPVDVGTFFNANLFNSPEGIQTITGTLQTPIVQVAAVFQGNNYAGTYTVDASTNTKTRIGNGVSVKLYDHSYQSSNYGPKSYINVPMSSAGFILSSASTAASELIFFNPATGQKDTLPYKAAKTQSLCSPYSINGKILVNVKDPVTNKNTILSTDGTLAGSVLLPFTTRGNSGFVNYESHANGKMYLSSLGNKTSLYVTDGTAAGTKQILNGDSPNLDVVAQRLAVSGDVIYYVSNSFPSKFYQVNGDSNSRNLITPFLPVGPTRTFNVAALAPVGRTGKIVIRYNYFDFLNQNNNDYGLGVVQNGSSTIQLLKSTGNVNIPEAIQFIAPIRSGGCVFVHEKMLIKTNLTTGNADTLRLTNLGLSATQKIQSYFEFDGRLFMTHSEGSTSGGQITITDGTVAGSQLMNGGALSGPNTVDEAGVAWYSIGLNLFRINGTPFTGITNHEINQQENIVLFPNPASAKVNLSGSKTGENIAVFNTSGIQYSLNVQEGRLLDISSLSPGLYILRNKKGGLGKLMVE